MKKIYFLFLALFITSISFGQVLITEIADPNNDANGRFIELHNMGATAVDFTEGTGWQIDKYLNGNPGINISLDLTGTIAAGGFYIIAYDVAPGSFATIYGFAPDQLDAVSNGVAGSNGDDDLALVNGSDVMVDFWGVYDFPMDINTDNTGTCAEYEDGRAERLTSVAGPNPNFDESEWNVWADSDVAGCTSHQNAPRAAPGDFDPGAWGTPTCALSIAGTDAMCDAFTAGVDTYTATVDFTGGGAGAGTYSIVPSSGVLDLTAGDPDIDATGTMTITGINEGTDLTLTITDAGVCSLMPTVTSPTCEATASLPIFEPFTYADGSLVGNGSWVNHSGTAGDLLVTSGQALVQHGAPSEDVNIPFTPVAGVLYFGIDISVIDPGGPITSTDNEYFAHFKDDTFGFSARLDIVAPTAGGDYTVGIASDESTADATWATDLTYGMTYRITVKFDQDTNLAELWVDATMESDPSILGEDRADPGNTIFSFALRQSDSGENEGILVDNLSIAQTFNDTLLSTEEFSINAFNVYPNPTSDGIVNISTANSDIISVSVFDILGKQVLNQTVTNSVLDVSSLNSGIYILKMTQNGNSSAKKLVIN